MNPAELRAAAQRVLLARCCEHPAFVDACECAEQVGADIDALIRAGLLRPPAVRPAGTAGSSAAVQVRLTGTHNELAAVVTALGEVLALGQVSRFYRHRAPSLLGRIYLDAHLDPTRGGPPMTTTTTTTRPAVPAVAYVPLDRLRAHPDNVRRDLGDLRELADSIRLQGILQPLRVEHRPGGEFLRIRAGHRRAAAAQLAGLAKVPCVIVAEAETDEAITEMFAENLHRAGLSIAEKRDNTRRLMHEFGFTVDGVAAAVGVHPSTVYGWLREDPPPLQTRPDGRRQRPGAGRAYTPRVRLTDVHAVLTRWRPIAEGGLDADQARALLGEVAALLQGWTPPDKTTSVSTHILTQVAELDPGHRRPVRELADRIGCHPRLVERARAALRRAS